MPVNQAGSFDGCRSHDDIVERYKGIDRLYDQVRAEGRLRTPWEISPEPLAQRNGIRVLLDRNGRFLFGKIGYHRLLVSQILHMEYVPVALTFVHDQAVADGHLAEWREVRRKELARLKLELPPEGLNVRKKVFFKFVNGV